MTDNAPRRIVPNVWREFVHFLSYPAWRAPSGLGAPGALRAAGAMLGLNILVLAALVPLLSLWQHAFGLSGPDAFAQFPRQWLVPTVVLAAPAIEEAVFRGWLTARPRALWLLAVLVAGVAGFVLAGRAEGKGGLVLLGALAMGLIGWLILRRRTGPVAPIERHFAAVYFASALVFGLMHLANYPAASLVAVPLVLPQLWAGLLLGFVRMRIGLGASFAVHALSNLAAISVAMLGS